MGWGHEQQAKNPRTKCGTEFLLHQPRARCQLLSQGWTLGQVAAGAAPFRPRVAYLLRRAVPGWAVACLRGARLPVARVFPALARPHRCWGTCCGPLQPGGSSLRDQELRLLCQELRRRWSGAETSSPAARRQTSVEVEFTCWQIRASPARPRGQAPATESGLQLLASRAPP